MRVEAYGNRNFALYDDDRTLICVTVYKKGAANVMRLLQEARDPMTRQQTITTAAGARFHIDIFTPKDAPP